MPPLGETTLKYSENTAFHNAAPLLALPSSRDSGAELSCFSNKRTSSRTGGRGRALLVGRGMIGEA